MTQKVAAPDKDEAIAAAGNAHQNAAGGRRKGASWPWIALSVLLAGALIFALVKNPTAHSETVASVNGKDISKEQLYDEMVKQAGPQMLDSLITKELVNQEAEKANITITDQDLTQEVNEIKKQFPSEEQFNMMLAQSGMTMDQLKAELKTNAQIRKILGPQIKITEDEMKKYFDEHKDSYATPEQVRASHILVKTKEEADAILKELQNGADFAKLAKEKSQDPGSKDKGGDLGFFPRGQMDPAFEEAAFGLNKGELSGAVKSQYGYHIIKTVDKKAATTPTYEEKKEDVRKELFDQKLSEKSNEWLTKIKSEAKIENHLKK